MIIGVTGTNGAGKGTVVDYLVSKGFTHYSVRDEIVAEIRRRGLPVDRPSMNLVGTDLREKNGPTYFDDLFMARAQDAGIEEYVIESIRTVASARQIKARGGCLIVVDADPRIRYERAVLRGSGTDKVSYEDFLVQEAREMTSADPSNPAVMDISGVMQMADAVIHNDGSLEELRAQVDAALAKLR
jgi:dephospho-CoA kinase